MRCEEATLVDAGQGIAISQRCRRWTCPHCQPTLRAGLAKRIMSGKPTVFLTIKAPAALRYDPAAQQRAIVRGWAKLRRHPVFAGVQYLVVVEATKRGEPHWHVVMRLPFEPHSLDALDRKLREAMGSVGVVDIRLQSVADAEGLGRYLSKAPTKFEGSRRFWTSRRWIAAMANAARFVLSGILPLSIPRAANWMRRQGMVVQEDGRHRLTFSPP